MISKEFATTYFMTSITGKRTARKCKKCDWSVNRGFSNKNSLHSLPKNDKFDFSFRGKKCHLKIIINAMQIVNQII